jgi:hypothetical protein
LDEYRPIPESVVEHRWGDRWSVDIEVEVSIFGQPPSRGRLRDVSSSGGFIHTVLQVPELCSVRLDFVSGRAAQRCALAGQVVRRTQDGIGVEWFEFATASLSLLQLTKRQRVVPFAKWGRARAPYIALRPMPLRRRGGRRRLTFL